MLLDPVHSLRYIARARSDDALRAATEFRQARAARASAAAHTSHAWSGVPPRRPSSESRPRLTTSRPCAESGVRGMWQVALGLRVRCA